MDLPELDRDTSIPYSGCEVIETYQYYDLPFCPPAAGVQHKSEDLGEVLNGDRLASSLYDLSFRVDREMQPLCNQRLGKDELEKFRRAVRDDYYFQMYYDDLPIWGFVGKMEKIVRGGGTEFRYYLFTHVHFEINYNEDKVIEINVSTDPTRTVDISGDQETMVQFSYSVKWKETNIPYERRMEKYSRYSFLPQHLEIHWFSIINSCVTVLLLTGFLATILMRVLKNDFIKYAREDDADDGEETGWKYIHGDVFRFPKHPSLFCSIIGSGTQLLTMMIAIFLLALVGVFYPYNRGALYTASIVLYALTAGIAGYVSSCNFKQMGGETWVIGGIAGKNTTTEFYAPVRTTKYPREVPPLPWYRGTVPQMCMAGFLPFSAIYIELYYIFASVWGHKVYTIYSILFIVFLILLIVTAFITVALTYFQLAAEDHHWWWRSVLCGGSTGLFIYAYCFYYYNARSDMTGLMQTSFFFGYMGAVCYGFFLMLGSVGYRASLLFVRHIYRAIKCE
eukprot:jgi/Chlat1/6201/Chrsp44S05799